MRKFLYFTLLAVVCLACQPHVKYFNANPASLAAPGGTTLSWRISAGGGEMSADQDVVPSLKPPKPINQEGTLKESICKTTTFKISLPYGGERTVTVNVAAPCTCVQQVLTFSGTCESDNQGPHYPDTKTAQFAVVGGGNLQDLIVDAPFPVHAQHAGADIGFNNLGHPLFPLPPIPAAGDYTIYAPGAAGVQFCKDLGAGGPSGGGSLPAPDVHLTVVPKCQ
jgi:hypothetical protein